MSNENPLSPTGSALELDDDPTDSSRPGLRRRWTGPPSDQERKTAASQEEWELSDLREKAEQAVARLAKAVAGGGMGGAVDRELRQQLEQLNGGGETPLDVSTGGTTSAWAGGAERAGGVSGSPSKAAGMQGDKFGSSMSTIPQSPGASGKPRSNLASPVPPNLPLTMLKLMEAYIIGLADVPAERGGWSEAKRERALGIVKSLAGQLGQAERLASSESLYIYLVRLCYSIELYVGYKCVCINSKSGRYIASGW
jgi:hypothetical protein